MESMPKDLDEMLLEDESTQNLSIFSEQEVIPISDGGANTASNANTGNASVQQDSSLSPTTQTECDQDGLQSANSWLEPKTKTGKARKRLALACIACRRKKIRCSGEKPACSHCSRSMIPCVYKVTPRAPAPRTDYMAMLGKRLKRMEDRVIKIIPKNVTRDLNAIGRGVVKPAPPGQTQRLTAKASKKRSAAEAFDAELREWAKKKHVDHNGMIVDAVNEPGDENKLLKEGAEQLPPADIQEHLVEVFFENVYGQSYLLLHKPSFMRKLKAGMIPPVLMLAICAISARFSNHPKIDSEPAFLRGEEWAFAAGQIALARHDQPNITILTVLLILGLHEYGTCHGGRSWSFGGQALKMAYALQLHRELDHDPMSRSESPGGPAPRLLTFTDREIRRRTMWGCVLMDRFVSSGGYRPPLANTKFIEIQLPIAEMNFQMEIPGPTENLDGEVINPITDDEGQLADAKENMGVSAYVIKAVMLWGRAIDYMNTGLRKRDPVPMWSRNSTHAKLREEVHAFARNLPPKMKFTAENLQIHAVERIASQLIYLHIMIHQTTLFLNGFAIPIAPGTKPPKDMPPPFLAESARAAISAATEISKLMAHASDHHLTAPFAGYSAFTAGIVHIWCMFCKSSQYQLMAKENLRQTYRYLNKMKRYWGTFHYLIEATKERYRQFADTASQKPQSGGQMDIRGLEQYGGWFDKYPHGVSTSDWADPDTRWQSEAGDDAVMSHKSDLKGVEEFFASLSPSSGVNGTRLEARKSVSASANSTVSRERRERSSSLQQPLLTGMPRTTTSSSSPVRPEFKTNYKPGQHSTFILPTRLHNTSQVLDSTNYTSNLEVSQLDSSTSPYSLQNNHMGSVNHQNTLNYANHDSTTAESDSNNLQPHQQNGNYTTAQQDTFNHNLASTAQMHLQPTGHVSSQLEHAAENSNFPEQCGQPDSSVVWNAPFNIEAASLLDGFFQPGGWFLPFNIPSETPPADTSSPSAFPHPAHIEAHPTPQPIILHESYEGGNPPDMNQPFY